MCVTIYHLGRVTHIVIYNQASLVQTMACRLNGAKPLPEPMLNCVNWALGNKRQ